MEAEYDLLEAEFGAREIDEFAELEDGVGEIAASGGDGILLLLVNGATDNDGDDLGLADGGIGRYG